MRGLIATCTALLVVHLVDVAYFGGKYSETAEVIVRNVVFAVTNILRG
jgi:hypothetical protein